MTHSAHFLPNPDFRRAVANFVEGEREAVRHELEALRGMLPYRRSGSA